MSHLTYSNAFVDLEAGIVESYDDQGQPCQEYYATSSRATLSVAASPRDKTLNTKVDYKPNAHLSKLTNLEGIVGHEVGVASCSTAAVPITSSQLPEKITESNKATEDRVQYPALPFRYKPIVPEISPISVPSLKISSILITTQKKPAIKNYKPPTLESALLEGRVQTPSHPYSNTEAQAPSRPDKQ